MRSRSNLLHVLPLRNGVGASCIALPPGDWATLQDYLVVRFSHLPRDEIVRRLAQGEVMQANGEPVPPDAPYKVGQKLYYYRHIDNEPVIPGDIEILFQDDLLIAIDKPHFLPATPGGQFVQQTVLVKLKRLTGIETLAPMHRLDRETAGVMMFTIQPDKRDRYARCFRERAVQKRYEAIATYRDDLALPLHYRSRMVAGDSFMRMTEAPGEPNSETVIELLEQHGSRARYRLSPLTGKRHQLRVHLAGLGIPIENDQIYPVHVRTEDYDLTRPLQLLSRSIAFQDPVNGVQRYFESRRRLEAL